MSNPRAPLCIACGGSDSTDRQEPLLLVFKVNNIASIILFHMLIPSMDSKVKVFLQTLTFARKASNAGYL